MYMIKFKIRVKQNSYELNSKNYVTMYGINLCHHTISPNFDKGFLGWNHKPKRFVSYHIVDFGEVSETIENMHLAFSSKKFNSYNQILVVGQL